MVNYYLIVYVLGGNFIYCICASYSSHKLHLRRRRRYTIVLLYIVYILYIRVYAGHRKTLNDGVWDSPTKHHRIKKKQKIAGAAQRPLRWTRITPSLQLRRLIMPPRWTRAMILAVARIAPLCCALLVLGAVKDRRLWLVGPRARSPRTKDIYMRCEQHANIEQQKWSVWCDCACASAEVPRAWDAWTRARKVLASLWCPNCLTRPSNHRTCRARSVVAKN